MTNNLRKQMVGMKEDYILDAIYLLRNENPDYHEGIINHLINEYDEFSQSCEGDADSADPEELKSLLKESALYELNSYVLNMENMDRKPAAKIDPIKETPSLNKTSNLRKILREAESEIQVDMRPIHQLSSISRNPFSTEALTEIPVVPELNLIGQGRPRAIESGIHTQSIIDGRNKIIQSDIMTHLVMDHSQMSLKSDSFPFHKKEA